ncbi:hypothetical protein E5K00_21040 [Hymenobacter aquaticus]|uniref:Uncharacterized protein n=1 Tax=Hymenobacter aquaticus TaxID=1867101 RepID=A0A4Z0PSN8_9BACT|nr:hypothetical protein [Hymenobacter aquaticus]TGE20485.1 hypothetical protein E5K00_21040 [Hymenobacter aquaticus]
MLLLALVILGFLWLGPAFGFLLGWLLIGLVWALAMAAIGAFWLSIPLLLYYVLLEISCLRSAPNQVALRWGVISAYIGMALVAASLIATKRTGYAQNLLMDYHIQLWLPLLAAAVVPAWIGRRRWLRNHPPV